MFIIGQKKSEDDSFESIYVIFDTKDDREKWHTSFQVKNLSNIALKDIHYPFLILETFNNDIHSYKPIDKAHFETRVKDMNPQNDFQTIYFNLWLIQKNMYNISYPTEPCINGRADHRHFTDHDLQQIRKNGIDKYWQEILHA